MNSYINNKYNWKKTLKNLGVLFLITRFTLMPPIISNKIGLTNKLAEAYVNYNIFQYEFYSSIKEKHPIMVWGDTSYLIKGSYENRVGAAKKELNLSMGLCGLILSYIAFDYLKNKKKPLMT